ncbi:MAG: betaine/proline/choline family ABC transporter ATP-binding protein [Anaerolineae bacterium]|nr:betaine/proline/choline family ABC transporter ATP-binding protein [Candidatus Roseilinea sp.]MDW8450211.1 betaine/proline/choline family ABC transporter ATP-binding protein [Anaerolineae bacterium]
MLVCTAVWKIFGPAPEKAYAAIAAEAATGKLAYPDHVIAVRDVSFEVRKGETFVVMGLSGSGKSTLVRCLTRLTEPTAGEILIEGQDVRRMNDEALRNLRRHKVSMVFQNFGLLPHWRVLDNVAYGLEVCGVDKRERHARAMQMIELVGLKGWEHKYPRQLSGGMQQRVGLARALAVNPDILLFDEPFSALDPLIRREMQDELLRLQSTLHKTSVFITHDFAEALKIGDRIAIMKDGRFVQVGAPQELVLQPKDDYVRAFVKDAPRAKVLTAGAIMQRSPSGSAPNGRTVAADVHLEALLPMLAESDVPLTVVRDGAPVGIVDRACVIRALIDEQAN